jgi:predicted  nucleic acid-binding Zn-ribbon protein
MKRFSAEKWKPAKIAKMVRRLTKADEEIERVELNLEKLKDTLSKHGIEVDVVRKR